MSWNMVCKKCGKSFSAFRQYMDHTESIALIVTTNEANARLIAAAPTMADTLARILRAIEWSESSDRMTSEEQATLIRETLDLALTVLYGPPCGPTAPR